jgi:hypothetical protein
VASGIAGAATVVVGAATSGHGKGPMGDRRAVVAQDEKATREPDNFYPLCHVTRAVLRPLPSTLLLVVLAACSSGTDITPKPDAATDASSDGGSPGDNTVGKPCTTDKDCDTTGRGVTKCSNDAFTNGVIYPSPVCVGVGGPSSGMPCSVPTDPMQVPYCDGMNGLCQVENGNATRCLPVCYWRNDGKPPTGCAGNDACTLAGYGSMNSAPIGFGYCLGGCKADADCAAAKAGSLCQTDDGLCVDTLVTRTKKLGDTCTQGDANAVSPPCNCVYGTQTGLGYCSQFCEIGGAPCPTGYACAAQVPKTFHNGSPAFTQDPPGLAGFCFKSCTGAMDSSCATLNAYCNTNDVAGDVCTPGSGP